MYVEQAAHEDPLLQFLFPSIVFEQGCPEKANDPEWWKVVLLSLPSSRVWQAKGPEHQPGRWFSGV
eukprot:3867921-Lingulodinium_polyedra.AAC.1